jgi:translation initiation factor 3 subunit L
MPIDEDTFNLPPRIRDFLFDIHEATRRSLRVEDVNNLYEHEFKEITDKYFNKSAWPDVKAVAEEVQHDSFFLYLYSEMTMRHMTTRLKPHLSDHLNSWQNYKNLFEAILHSNDTDIMLTTRWIYDIMQEFAYQFQGFCQYRYINHSNPDNLETLRKNRDAWNLTETLDILNRLIAAGRSRQADPQATIVQQFGYFATIELARIHCLLGDFSSSLAAVADIKLNDRDELFNHSPICHFNLFYQIGVSQMMLGRMEDALVTLSECVLLVLGLAKPGASAYLRTGVFSTLNRMMEKALALLAILIVLTPYYRVEDQVRAAVDAKFSDKMRRLSAGDAAVTNELFESACPKFICPIIPDHTVPRATNDVYDKQVRSFVEKVMEDVPFLKVRNFLSMYKSIEITKLVEFTGITEESLRELLDAHVAKVSNPSAKSTDELRFSLNGNLLVVERGPNKIDHALQAERFFLSNIRRQKEIVASVNKSFADLKL